MPRRKLVKTGLKNVIYGAFNVHFKVQISQNNHTLTIYVHHSLKGTNWNRPHTSPRTNKIMIFWLCWVLRRADHWNPDSIKKKLSKNNSIKAVFGTKYTLFSFFVSDSKQAQIVKLGPREYEIWIWMIYSHFLKSKKFVHFPSSFFRKRLILGRISNFVHASIL